MPFANGLIYIETTKPIYYPGETLEGSVHIMVTKTIEDARTLQLVVKGKETFNFKSYRRREEESCRNHYKVLDENMTLAKFHTGTIAEGQYTFKFKVYLPLENLPASFMHRQLINNEGFINAKIRYSVGALLTSDQ